MRGSDHTLFVAAILDATLAFMMGDTSSEDGANAAARLLYDPDISWIGLELVATDSSEHAITRAKIDGSKVARSMVMVVVNRSMRDGSGRVDQQQMKEDEQRAASRGGI